MNSFSPNNEVGYTLLLSETLWFVAHGDAGYIIPEANNEPKYTIGMGGESKPPISLKSDRELTKVMNASACTSVRVRKKYEKKRNRESSKANATQLPTVRDHDWLRTASEY